jgi:hypothetical protein
VRAALPDEYQDATSAGSLAKARGCWLDLVATGTLLLPQRLTFVFRCPTHHMAIGLMDFLRYTNAPGFACASDRVSVPEGDPWQVAGTTHATAWTLPGLEHLFMRLRSAGSRYESALVALDLQQRS